jgi:hypothetical protein
MKVPILKIKVGDVYINGVNHPVFQSAFRKESRKGEVYYEIKSVVFLQKERADEKVN